MNDWLFHALFLRAWLAVVVYGCIVPLVYAALLFAARRSLDQLNDYKKTVFWRGIRPNIVKGGRFLEKIPCLDEGFAQA